MKNKTVIAILATVAALQFPAVMQPVYAESFRGMPANGADDINQYIQDAFDAATSGTEVVFPYMANTIYRIYCQPGYITDIRLSPGEKITYVGGGDTARWIIDRGTVGRGGQAVEHIYVKPVQRGIATNIIINTDKKIYQLSVKAGNYYNPSVSWLYEKEAVFSASEKKIGDYLSINPEKLNFKYKWNHENYPWAPKRVFDDGKKTYLMMKQGMAVDEAPAFFVLDKKDKILLVNYRLVKGCYIVDRLFDKAQLVVGRSKVTVKKDR